MEERGVSVDHSSINRWAIRFLPLIEKMARKHKHPVGGSWRMDETYIKVEGAWKYLYRALDKQGKTVDFLLTAKRDHAAARRFFDKAMGANGDPDKVVMDKSGSNKAAIVSLQADSGFVIAMRQSKYLNNIAEQDYGAINGVTRPMLGFKTFRCARIIIAGIGTMHMVRKNQVADVKDRPSSAENQFYSLEF